jgi:hypothetical protein
MITELGQIVSTQEPPTFWEHIRSDPKLGVLLVLMLMLLTVMAILAVKGIPSCENRRGAGDDSAEKA